MKVRLGDMEIGLWRYLGLWMAVVVVFAVQRFLDDATDGRTWSAFDYLRWGMIQWYTWAALAPLVFRLAQRYPIQPPLRHPVGGRVGGGPLPGRSPDRLPGPAAQPGPGQGVASPRRRP